MSKYIYIHICIKKTKIDALKRESQGYMNMLLKGNQKVAQVLVEPGSFSLWQETKKTLLKNAVTCIRI